VCLKLLLSAEIITENMKIKEFETVILKYLADNFNALAYITHSDKAYMNIEMSNKSDIDFCTLQYISSLTRTINVSFDVEIRYRDCDRYGIISILDHELEE
jgi:hypothetical protein